MRFVQPHGRQVPRLLDRDAFTPEESNEADEQNR
jgi:hypothetical protein